MRSAFMILAAVLATASPALAQGCDCARDGTRVLVDPAEASGIVVVPRIGYTRETVLVPRTRLVPRTVYVARTRLVPRPAYAPGFVYAGHGYPAGYRYGDATYVPPGISYPCLMGTLGCDSSAVGPLDGH